MSLCGSRACVGEGVLLLILVEESLPEDIQDVAAERCADGQEGAHGGDQLLRRGRAQVRDVAERVVQLQKSKKTVRGRFPDAQRQLTAAPRGASADVKPNGCLCTKSPQCSVMTNIVLGRTCANRMFFARKPAQVQITCASPTEHTLGRCSSMACGLAAMMLRRQTTKAERGPAVLTITRESTRSRISPRTRSQF